MYFISALLFGISASLDAFIVGITYGIRKIHITFVQNMIVSLITLTGTVLSIVLGMELAPLFPAEAAKMTGSVLLLLLGTYYIIKFIILSLRKYLRSRQLTEEEIQQTSKVSLKPCITFRETVILGIALSVNNMGIGIGASFAGLKLIPTAAITFFLSVCLLFLGNKLGKTQILQVADKFADLVTGILLVGLGLYEMLF